MKRNKQKKTKKGTEKGNSKYARKREYLHKKSKEAGHRVFGFELKEKPWL